MAKRKAIAPAEKTAEERYDEIEKELAELAPQWKDWASKPQAELDALVARDAALQKERKQLQDEYAAQMRARRELEKVRAAGLSFFE